MEAGLKLLQQFYLDLEKFLSWLTEAETTCNVLIDATNKERLQQQPEAAKRLLAQWKVGTHVHFIKAYNPAPPAADHRCGRGAPGHVDLGCNSITWLFTVSLKQ